MISSTIFITYAVISILIQFVILFFAMQNNNLKYSQPIIIILFLLGIVLLIVNLGAAFSKIF
jgi:hypothetical protein